MVVGTSYKQAQLAENWDAIVIGSGIGGLTSAVLLGLHGDKRVLVLERHYEAGGFTHTFRRPGFRWDVGLHYIGQLEEGSQTRRAFDHITGGKVQWNAMPEVYDRVIIAGKKFEFAAGLERFRGAIQAAFPSETAAIDRYLKAVQASNRAMKLYFAEKAVPGPVARAAGRLMRAPAMRWAKRTTREVLESLTSNQELIGVLTAQWGDYGLPPGQSSFAIHATIAEHYFGGAWYPAGGAGSIAQAMVPLIEKNGGCVVTSADVAGILLEGTRAIGVRMSDGREFRADVVVSDAGAGNTFDRLLPAEMPELAGLRSELRQLQPSTAHVSLYVGLDRSDAELGLQGTNVWVYPSFDHDANVARCSADFARDGDGEFAGVYVSFPSAKDPSFQAQYPGHSTIEAIAMVPYAAFAAWAQKRWKHRGADYDAMKSHLCARLMAEVERQAPQVKGHVACAELSTPVTTQHFMNYGRGEIYGLAATPARFATRSLGARTPVKGLYLTGQDVTCLGVVGALFGGVISTSAVLGKNVMGTVTNAAATK